MGGMVDVALRNARRGFRVFPLQVGGKLPAHKGWQSEATTDETVIRSLWNGTEYNVGVATGEGLIVVDADVKQGKLGLKTFAALGLHQVLTFLVDTPSGGLHAYFTGLEARNSVEKLGEGLDVRGSGGYVVAEGSVVTDPGAGVSVGSYRVRAERAPAGSPESLRERLGPGAGVSHPSAAAPTPAGLLDAPEALDRARAYLAGDAPPAIEGRGGDDTTYKVALVVRDMGVSEFECWSLMDEHWNGRCSPPWAPEDLERKVRNAYAYGENPVGVRAPEIDFADVKIAPPEVVKGLWSYAEEASGVSARWLFHGVLEASGVAIVVGESGSGKTFFNIAMAHSVAIGGDFFSMLPDISGASLFLFAGSEGGGFPLRLRALGAHYHRLPIAWRTVSNLRDRATMQALADDLVAQKAEMSRRYKTPLRLVFLETLSASGLMEKENDNAQGAQAMAALGRIGRELDVLFVVTHHPGKNSEDPRGASALLASADYVIHIRRDGKSAARHVELVKGRNAPERQIGSYTLLPVVVGSDERGREIKSLTLSMGDPEGHIARRIRFLEPFVQAWEMIEAVDIIEVDGEEWVYDDGWMRAFAALGGAGEDRSNRNRRFRGTLTQALQYGLVESRPGDEGRLLRLKPSPFA